MCVRRSSSTNTGAVGGAVGSRRRRAVGADITQLLGGPGESTKKRRVVTKIEKRLL